MDQVAVPPSFTLEAPGYVGVLEFVFPK